MMLIFKVLSTYLFIVLIIWVSVQKKKTKGYKIFTCLQIPLEVNKIGLLILEITENYSETYAQFPLMYHCHVKC